MMNRNKQGLKKYKSLLAALVLIVVTLCGCSKLQSKESTETELAAGQRKAEIQVVSITGNELTYIEVEEETETETEQVTEAASEDETETDEVGTDISESEAAAAQIPTSEKGAETAEENDTAAGEVSQMSQSSQSGQGGRQRGQMPGEMGGEMPQMNQGGGRMPGGMNGEMLQNVASGQANPSEQADQSSENSQNGMQMPEGMSMPEGMELPEGMEFSGDTAMGGSFENPFASAVETTTVYLPVGIKVHTGNGKTSTFSILEAGDQLEVLFEENENGEEVITEIWLVGTE